MGEEVKKEQADLVVLNADPVEVVALTYDSERIPVKYQKIGGDAHTPRRGSAQAAGYDVYSAVSGEIPPEKTVHFLSNIITKPEPGWCLKLYNRSSLAANHLVCILGGPMVIDNDYRRIVMVPLHNFSKEKPYFVKKGDRIAQLLMERCYKYTGITTKIYKKQNPLLEDREDLAVLAVKFL